MSEFLLLDLVVIHKGGMVARCRLQMPSGLIIAANNITRGRKDPQQLLCFPVGEKNPGGGFTPVVDFATRELREAWQAAAMDALKPRWGELTEPTREVSHGFTGF